MQFGINDSENRINQQAGTNIINNLIGAINALVELHNRRGIFLRRSYMIRGVCFRMDD
jgi:hypothetical protein